MKDVTSTSFGLVIAYLLPGLAALLTSGAWFSKTKIIFDQFLSAQSSVGLFFFVVLLALTVGLQISIVRWAIFELWFCRRHKLASFAGLKDEDRMIAFRSVIDEHYRYHQFWGGMFIVIPFAFCAFLKVKLGINLDFVKSMVFGPRTGLPVGTFVFYLVPALAGFILTGAAACNAFVRYTTRGEEILGEKKG